MKITRRRMMVAAGLALYLLTVCFAGGMAVKQWHQFLMRAERIVESGR